jgi:hypothetical protein
VHTKRIWIVALFVFVASGHAQAVRFDYSAELGFLHSDNINLSASQPVSENVLIPRLDFHISELGSNVRADVVGGLEYRDYLGGEFGNEFRGTLNGSVDWSIIPQRMNWIFADNLGLYPISLRDPGVPGNLQQTNVFTTGPTFFFRFTPTLQGQAEARLIDSRAEESSAFDSTRLSGAFRVFHELGATRQLSGNIEAQTINFDDNALADDYTRYSAFAGYTQTLRRVDIELAAGYTYLEFDSGGDASGPLARASADWRLSERSTLGLGLAWQYSDAALDMLGPTPVGSSGVGTAVISPDVFRERHLNGHYTFQSTRLRITTRARATTFRYESDAVLASDRDEFVLGVDLGYLLRPRTTVGFIAENLRREYTTLDASDRDSRYAFYLSQQMTRHWRWRLDATRYERRADAGADSFDENSLYLRIGYTR